MKRILFYVSMLENGGDHFLEDFNPVSAELTKRGIYNILVNTRTEPDLQNVYEKYRPTDVFFRLLRHGTAAKKFFKSKGCRIQCILHGWPVRSAGSTDPIHIDKIYSWSDLTDQFLINEGFPESNIVCTGSPRFDSICALRDKKQFNKVPVIGFASIPYHVWKQDNFKYEAMQYAKAVYALDKSAFPVIRQRLHPQEQSQGSWLAEYSGLANGRVEFCNPYDMPFADWIMGIDIMITTQSGTAIEAAAIGVPVVTMSFFNREEYVPTGTYGLSTQVLEKGSLYRALIESYPNMGKINDNIGRFVKHVDGTISKRIVDEIMRE